METMPTWNNHKRTKGTTYLAFLLLICALLPFDIVLEYHEG